MKVPKHNRTAPWAVSSPKVNTNEPSVFPQQYMRDKYCELGEA